MSSDKYRNRYYSKKKYEAAIETLGVGFVFLFVAILSLFFIAFGVPFIGLRSWGYWLFIPAFFIILAGVQQYYTNNKFQSFYYLFFLWRHPSKCACRAPTEHGLFCWGA